MGQPAYLEKMISIQGQGHLAQRGWASDASTSPSSHTSDHKNQDHKDPLRSNKSPAGSLEIPTEPSQVLPSKASDVT